LAKFGGQTDAAIADLMENKEKMRERAVVACLGTEGRERREVQFLYVKGLKHKCCGTVGAIHVGKKSSGCPIFLP